MRASFDRNVIQVLDYFFCVLDLLADSAENRDSRGHCYGIFQGGAQSGRAL